MLVAQEAVIAVAAHGLVGSCLRAPDEALRHRVWDRFLATVATHRLPGHLVDAIAAGAFPATPDQFDQAVELHTCALAHTVRLERLLLRVTACLDDAGIDHRVLKGPALAHTTYADASVRVYGDVDVLIPSDHVDRAPALLESQGFRPTPRLRWVGVGSRHAQGVALRWADELEVDLHFRRAHDVFGRSVDDDRLFGDETEFTVGGRVLRTLAPEQSFLYACYDATIGAQPRLSALRDVAELVLGGSVDGDLVLAAASLSRSGEVAVAKAVRTTWECFALADIVPLSVWALRYQPDRYERRALHGFRGAVGLTARALDRLRAVRRRTLGTPFLRPLQDHVGSGRGRPSTHRGRR